MNSNFTTILIFCMAIGCIRNTGVKEEWYVKLTVENASENGKEESIDIVINDVSMVRGDSCSSNLTYVFESSDLEIAVSTKDGRLLKELNYSIPEFSDGVWVEVVYDNNIMKFDTQFVERHYTSVLQQKICRVIHSLRNYGISCILTKHSLLRIIIRKRNQNLE